MTFLQISVFTHYLNWPESGLIDIEIFKQSYDRLQKFTMADFKGTSSGGVFDQNTNQGDLHRRNVVGMEEGPDADAQLAAEFGYKPVFKREFGYLSTFSFAVSISGLFATTMTTFSYPIMSGGSAAAVWCWAISGAGCMCIAVSSMTATFF